MPSAHHHELPEQSEPSAELDQLDRQLSAHEASQGAGQDVPPPHGREQDGEEQSDEDPLFIANRGRSLGSLDGDAAEMGAGAPPPPPEWGENELATFPLDPGRFHPIHYQGLRHGANVAHYQESPSIRRRPSPPAQPERRVSTNDLRLEPAIDDRRRTIITRELEALLLAYATADEAVAVWYQRVLDGRGWFDPSEEDYRYALFATYDRLGFLRLAIEAVEHERHIAGRSLLVRSVY